MVGQKIKTSDGKQISELPGVRSEGEGNGTPLQYSCLENLMDGGAWWAAVHRVAKSRTRLSNFTFTFHFHALEKEMATHSSVLAWRIPGTGEAGGLPSMGLHRVGHDWSDLAAAEERERGNYKARFWEWRNCFVSWLWLSFTWICRSECTVHPQKINFYVW